MPYVLRRADNSIEGMFRWPNEKATEFLADDDPEVIAMKKRHTESERLEPIIQSDPVLRRLIAVMADELNKTPRELLDAIKAKS